MIGIIGGTGLENPDILKGAHDEDLTTPYGHPSSPIKVGFIKGVKVAILSRHGRQHTIPPTQVNNKANIWALKKLGCEAIIATTAVGSLKQDYGRGKIVIPHQLIDFTRRRELTFFDTFEPGKLKHTTFADPFNMALWEKLCHAAAKKGYDYINHGVLITIEGPRFSTRAESELFRNWGADIINMSTAPEAILSAEIGIPYATIALITDYDCWCVNEEAVTTEVIEKVFNENVGKITEVLKECINSFGVID